MIKIGNCYIASFTKAEMPVRIESQEANGHWKSRSLTHGRIVFVKTESQLIRECNADDLAGYAKTVVCGKIKKRRPYRCLLRVNLPTRLFRSRL